MTNFSTPSVRRNYTMATIFNKSFSHMKTSRQS
uniref:Uncharacterized protein n=1 Tax=Anguilla anguilla TaxID=7936 RepID=A0A0E9QMA7_ANGAN